MRQVIVSKEKSKEQGNCFGTINEALASLGDAKEAILLIRPGIYHEKIEIRRSGVTLRGTGVPEDTILEFGDYANMRMDDGTKRGTFRSYVLLLDGDRNVLENLTVRNVSYPRSKVGQALALYADGDGIVVRNCHLESYQDTLFTGPLPPTAMVPGGFTGPKEFDERRMGRQRYESCVISGDVDFIFGSASAYFKDCTLVSRNGRTDADEAPEQGILGYVTAASTPEGWPVGYVFEDCRFVSEDCPPGSVYLGRPWRNFAKTVFLHCEMGEHIHPAGFHDWNKAESHVTAYYGEYESYGLGGDTAGRAEFAHQMTAAEAKQAKDYFDNAREEDQGNEL